MKLAILGASGEIGARLTQHLLLNNAAPRALSRRISARLARWPDLDFRDVDLRSSDLAAALAGCDAVINCAVDKGEGGVRDRIRRNVEGCRNLIAAAKAAGVQRLVHLSSIVVKPPRLTAQAITDDAIYSTETDWYARAKIDTEKLLLNEAGSLPVVVIRPGIVYGPYLNWSRAIFLRLLEGPVAVAFEGTGICAAAHVDDVVGLSMHLASCAHLRRKVLYCVHPEAVTWPQFYRHHAAAAGFGDDRVHCFKEAEVLRAVQPPTGIREMAKWAYRSPLVTPRMRERILSSWLGSRMAQALPSEPEGPIAKTASVSWPAIWELEMHRSDARFGPELTGEETGYRYSLNLQAGMVSTGDWWNYRCVGPASEVANSAARSVRCS